VRVLVTGGAGFIGSAVVRELLRRRHRVTVLDDLSTGSRANLAGLDCVLVVGDVRDPVRVRQAMAGCGAVVHLAARVSVPESVADPAPFVEVNVGGTFAVLEAARALGVARVVYAGSSSAYGEQSPAHEGLPTRPQSPYAAAKLAGESLCLGHSARGVAAVVLRFFNVYGPRQRATGGYAAVVPAFLAALRVGRAPSIYGDGEQTRDLVYVEAVARAVVAAIRARGAEGAVVNVGSGRATSVNAILRAACRAVGTRCAAVYAPERPGDVRYSVAQIGLVRRVLGWRPVVGLREGLRRTVAAG